MWCLRPAEIGARSVNGGCGVWFVDLDVHSRFGFALLKRGARGGVGVEGGEWVGGVVGFFLLEVL